MKSEQGKDGGHSSTARPAEAAVADFDLDDIELRSLPDERGDLRQLGEALLDLVPDGRDPPAALGTIVRHLPLIIWAADADESIRFTVGGGLASLGLEEGQLDGQPLSIWGDEALAQIRTALHGEATTFESQGLLNGSRWALVNHVYPNPDGGVIGVSIDNTHWYRTEQALAVSEERFRSLAESAPVGIFLSGPDGGNLYTNPALQHLLGLGAEEALGQGWRRAVHPDDRDAVVAAARRMRDDGQPFDLDYRVRLDDGEERWVHARAERFYEPDGTEVGMVGTALDVTDRRRVLDQLVESEERFRTLAEAAPVGIFLAGLDGEVVYRNPRMTELASSTIDGFGRLDWREVIHPDDRECMEAAQRAFVGGGGPFDVEFRVVGPDGSHRWVQTHADNVIDDAGRPMGIVGTVFDVTSRHEANEAQRESEELTTAIIENAAEGIVTMDESGVILAFNAAAERIFGHDSDDAIGQSFGMLLPDSHRETYLGYLSDFRESGRTVLVEGPAKELPGLHRDGSTVPVEMAVTVAPWRGRTAFCALVRDVSERREFERQLEHQATHDPLTALPNRALLAAQAESALARAYRNEKSVAVLFISLDRMKLVTDSLGHRAGDELRVAVAHRLQGLVRPTDTVTRFGEDEFVVLAEDLDSLNDAVDLAQRIIDAIEVPFDLTVDEAFIGVNVGISFALDGLGTAESLISDADVAMFRAKEKGGSQFEIFDSEMRAWVNSRRKTENALRHGLERDEFELHYQPIISLHDGSIKGFEALVRWDRPHLGMTPPGEFIPVAEESGLIVPLGEWILDSACTQLATWQEQRPDHPLTLSVNLSGRQLAQRTIATTVDEALRRQSADPGGLVLEITETVLLDDVETAVRTLDELREIGVRLSIDDFGTGYSSLTYIRRFPIDVVKIDRSFVNQLGTDSRDASIVETVITLAQGLELDCVAEGVETSEQLHALTSLDCTFAQGYYFAKPQPVGEADSLLDGRGFELS